MKNKNTRTNQFIKKLALLLATTLDISPYNIHKSSEIKLSILAAKKIIEDYEKMTSRVLSEQVKFYMLGTMIDQGYISLAKQYQSSQVSTIINDYNKTKQNVLSNNQGNDEKENSIFDKLQNQKQQQKQQQHKKQHNNPQKQQKLLTLYVLFQKLQEQYYRQLLTYQILSKQFDNQIQISRHKKLSSKQLGFLALQKLDKKGHGSFLLKDLLNFISKVDGGILKARVKQQLQKCNKNRQSKYIQTIKNKLCNNAHCDASSSKPTKFIKTHLSEYPIHIENLIQLFYRIYQQEKSLTYKIVSTVLNAQEKKVKQQFEQYQQKVEGKCEKQQKQQVFLAELSHIKDTAYQILRKSKYNNSSLNYRYERSAEQSPSFKYSEILRKEEEERQKSVHRQKLHIFSSPSPKLNTNILNYSRTQPETYRNKPVYEEFVPDTYRRRSTIKSTNTNHQNHHQDFIASRKSHHLQTPVYQKLTPQIRQFNTIPSKQQIRFRVKLQLEKINEEKLRNRQKFYDIFGKS